MNTDQTVKAKISSQSSKPFGAQMDLFMIVGFTSDLSVSVREISGFNLLSTAAPR